MIILEKLKYKQYFLFNTERWCFKNKIYIMTIVLRTERLFKNGTKTANNFIKTDCTIFMLLC